MTQTYNHGIRNLVSGPVKECWKWESDPPEAVKGYRQSCGELQGSRDEAVAAAKSQIERQHRQHMNS